MKHTLTLFAFVTLISSGYAQVPEYVPVDGLLGWYPFNGNAQDESGNEKHGQSDGAVLASDRFEAESSAFMFDGSSSIVLPDVEVSNSFSSSFWLLADASSDQSDAVVDGSSGNFIRIVNEVDESWQFGANSICSGNPYSQDGFALGDWVHGAVVFDGDSISFFLNGTFTNSLPDCSDYWKLQFIGFADNGSHGFDGIIDDVGFWNRGLTVEEISTLYNWTPFGCANYGACNYDSMATIDDGSCDYSCCPGPGCCDIGMHWDWELGMCQITNLADTNLDGCVQLNDLLDLLSAYGNCAADELVWQCGDPLEYQGYDYETVQIGEQCWFAEDLHVIRFSDDSDIPEVVESNAWEGLSSPARYEIPRCLDGSESNEYSGMLYNGFCVRDERGLCPLGWIVPTDGDWQELEIELGMDPVVASQDSESGIGRGTDQGKQLKAGPDGLLNWNGEDVWGFNVVPGGSRGSTGNFVQACFMANYWSSSQFNDERNFERRFRSEYDGIGRQSSDLNEGWSVRCIQVEE